MTEKFSILPQTILDELCLREDSSVSGSSSHTASSLDDTDLTCICVLHNELCSQTEISGSVTEPMQRCPVENHVCFNVESPEGSKITHIQF